MNILCNQQRIYSMLRDYKLIDLVCTVTAFRIIIVIIIFLTSSVCALLLCCKIQYMVLTSV